MKIYVLPNWCKNLGLGLFLVFLLLSGYDAFMGGFTEGLQSLSEKEVVVTESNPFFKEYIQHLFSVGMMISMIIYMVAKEIREDEFIDKKRLESFQLATLICLFIALVKFAVIKETQVEIGNIIAIFLSLYLLIFWYKKRG